MGLDDSLSKYKDVEATYEKLNTDKSEDSTLKTLTSLYEDWLAINETEAAYVAPFNEFNQLDLTPALISSFCIKLEEYQHSKFFRASGYVINNMIQSSYNNGYNDFSLPLFHHKTPIDYVGMNLVGTQSRKLNLYLNGEIGDLCAHLASNLNLSFNGNVGRLAGNAANSCKLIYNADTDDYAANSANFCSLIFNHIPHRLEQCCTNVYHCKIHSPHYSLLKELKHLRSRSCTFHIIQGDNIEEVTSWL